MQAAFPQRLLTLNREPWSIEAVHHVLDRSFDEDRSRIRTGYGPQNITRLRRFAIGLIQGRGLGVAYGRPRNGTMGIALDLIERFHFKIRSGGRKKARRGFKSGCLSIVGAVLVAVAASPEPEVADAAEESTIRAVLTMDDIVAKESDGAIEVTATLDRAVADDFTVKVSTKDGSAKAGADYLAVSGHTLSFLGHEGED